MIRNRRTLLTCLASVAALSACGRDPSGAERSTAKDDIPASQPISIEAIERFARGFDVGALMSTNRVFVFFDPQCPLCARLWDANKALAGQARITWIPVGLMNAYSSKQAATILAAPRPELAMNEHEQTFVASGYHGGLKAIDTEQVHVDAVARNTRLFESFGLKSVPYIVGRHRTSGELFTRAGGMAPDLLAGALGW